MTWSAEDEDMKTALAEQRAWDVIPDEIREWMLQLDLHMTEHDDRHARMALRAAWPAIKEYLMHVVSHRAAVVEDSGVLLQAIKDYTQAFQHGTADEADKQARRLVGLLQSR